MEINDLFQFNGKVYKVIDNPAGICAECAGLGKISLCKKLPACMPPVTSKTIAFKSLNSFELRQAKKQKINIQIL